jgi:hypothetical protein
LLQLDGRADGKRNDKKFRNYEEPVSEHSQANGQPSKPILGKYPSKSRKRGANPQRRRKISQGPAQSVKRLVTRLCGIARSIFVPCLFRHTNLLFLLEAAILYIRTDSGKNKGDST